MSQSSEPISPGYVHAQANVPSYAQQPGNSATTVTHLVDPGSPYLLPRSTVQLKRTPEAVLLWFPPLGLLGFYHLYLRRPYWFLGHFFTCGFFGLGWIIDAFRLSMLVREANKQVESGKISQRKNLSDAYILWLPPFGLLGLHHFYLRRPCWGILYFFTLGLFGIGWLVDMCLLPRHTKACNDEIDVEEALQVPREKSLALTILLTLFPITGILGVHHLYLGDPFTFVCYFLTLGNCGLGWICDWFRIAVLLRRAKERPRPPDDWPAKHLDHAYILWLPPAGILGLHHLYLRRYMLFALYFFTLGVFGIGWLADIALLPQHLKTYRLLAEKERQSRGRLSVENSTGRVHNVVVIHTAAPANMPAGFYPPAGVPFQGYNSGVNYQGYQQQYPPTQYPGMGQPSYHPNQPYCPTNYGAVASNQPSCPPSYEPVDVSEGGNNEPPPYTEKD